MDGSGQRCSWGGKRGSGEGIAGTCVYSTGNEFSRWSIEVVNPHSGPLLSKINIVRGDREPTLARARVGGRHPT